ncbi:MAG: branched-chain amino acid ABC transporter permease [Thermodesulfobacteriota bacterium]
MQKILENLVTGLTLGSLYALISIGMTMVYGLLKILHVAHAGVYVLGAYLGLLTYQYTGSFWLAFPAAAAGCAVLGYLMYIQVYRRVQDAKPLVPLIIGIGMFTALGDAFRLLAGPYSRSFRHQFSIEDVRVGLLKITSHQLLIMAGALILLGLVWCVVNRTKAGLAWQASSQDREVAMGLGVNTVRYFGFNFMFGSALAGLAGVLVAVYYAAVNPIMGDVWAYKVFAIMVLGGLGNVLGTVVASFFLGLAETFTIAYFGYFLPRDSIAFILMILVLIFMPYGVMGGRQRG